MADLIKPFTFMSINHNRLAEEHGLKEGDVVFIAAAKAFPMSEEDPYTQRIFFFVQKTVDDKIDDESGVFMLDAKSLSFIDPEEHKIYVNVNEIVYDKPATTH
jgi:hypothetical protein